MQSLSTEEKKLEDQFVKLGKVMDDGPKGAAKALSELTGTVADVGAATISAATGFGLVAIAIGGATLGAIALNKALTSLTDRAQAVDQLRVAFDQLGGSSTLIEAATKSSHGLVSEIDLLKLANEGLIRDVPGFQKNFAQLVDIGTRLGQAFKGSATEGVETLVHAVENATPRTLRQFGIYVDTTAVLKKYAEEHDVAANQLTEFAKRQALMTATIEAAKSKAEELAPAINTVANAHTGYDNALKSVIAKQGEAANKNPVLIQGYEALAEAIKHVDLSGLIDKLATLEGFFLKLAAGAIRIAGDEIENFSRGLSVLSELSKNLAAGDLHALGHAIETVNNDLNGLNSDAGEVGSTIGGDFGKGVSDANGKLSDFDKALQKFQETLAKVTGTGGDDGLKGLQRSMETAFREAAAGKISYQELAIYIASLEKGFGTTAQKIKDFTAAFVTSSKAGEEYKKQVKEIGDELDKLNEKLDPDIKGLGDALLDLEARLDEGKIPYDDYKKQVEDLGKQFLLSGGDAKVFFDLIKKGHDVVKDGATGGFDLRKLVNQSGLSDTEFKAGSFFGFDLGDGISDATQKSLANGLQSSVTSAITSVAQGGDWKAAAQQLGSGIGNAVGNAVAPGLGPIGGLIIGQITKDLTSSKSSELIRGALTVAFGPTGFIAGSLLQQGKSQGSQDRRALDKYFNDLFDHTHIQAIINGQLKQIKDLDFVGNQDKSKGVFAGLGDQAKKEFGAVGDAIQLLQGQALDLGVNLDAVLANNLGGNLENLSVLLKKMGVSFEDLGNKIIDAFLSGDESINQAYQDLKALDDLAHGGAFKDLSDAFTTFQQAEASGQGSQQLLDSIRAIGSEAETLHIKTLPALASYLTNTLHFDATQVAQFFEAMKASGLNSMEDLVNASNAQLIQFANNVQQIAAGAAPDTVTPNLTATPNYTPPTNFTAGSFSKSSGGGGSKSSGSASQDTTLQNLKQLVEASDDYKAVLESLRQGQLSNAQAGKILKDLYAEGTSVTKHLTDAQKAYDDAVKKGVGATELGKLATALQAAKEASDNFGKFNATLDQLKILNSDVNALGVLAKGAGLQFSDLEDQIASTFENGARSITDTQKKLDDLTNGLVNGGDKSPFEAFQNFLEGGKNGGQFSIEQFKAIFATASAAGETSLSQVQSQLASKFDPKQVAKIFTVLGQQGFNTFDSLKNISDTAVVEILGKIDKLGFPLGETSNRVKKILDQMNQLPARRTINLQLDFTSNLDSATKNLLELAGVEVPGQQPRTGQGVGGSKRPITTKKTTTPSRVIHR